jgi:hypothetical protein
MREGSIAVTQNDTAVTFGAAIADSVAGYKLRVVNHPEVFTIATHTAGATAATLDSPFTGQTNSAAAYKLMKTSYSLDAAVNSLMSPMTGYRGISKIVGITPERMDDQYPLVNLMAGVPSAFSLESDSTVRFSHGGLTNGESMRVEYGYRPAVSDLTDSTSSTPIVPLQWRHLLSDMALTYLLLDKNDDRSNAIALSARTGLAAMLKENRRRLTKIGGSYTGMIFPRQSAASNGRLDLLRTESGLIIGGP